MTDAPPREPTGSPTARPDSRRFYVALAVLLLAVGGAALLYLSAGLRASGGSTPVMPLDDTYIHFQYARALAEGYPFRYNPDQPPTSGATSLLYPLLLAVGYRIGFRGEPLSWWALLIGVLCWFGSAWLVYRIGSRDGSLPAHWIGLAVAVAFALTGSLGWAFMSGMETGLMVFATLLTLWYMVNEDRRGALIAGALVTLVRPEGLAIGLLASLYMATREPSRRAFLRHALLYSLPLLAALIQPALNLFATGSATASGLQAKSYLYLVPPDPGTILSSVANVAGRMWAELFAGLPYLLPGLVTFCALAVVVGLRDGWRARRLNPPILVFGWLLALTAVLSLLETAFWQFKRYQQPMVALLFPLTAWSFVLLCGLLAGRYRLIVMGILLSGLVAFSLTTTASFVQDYADNVHEVAFSQQPMARYVAANVPAGAIIGVHDIGVMRYLGGHPTYDVIGLTTPGAARAWRNGPGAAFEQMLTSAWRPAYFAIYRDALGLSYLADTGLFRQKLADFPSTQPPHNIASATNGGQAVYKADWTYAAFASRPWQPASVTAVAGMKLVDSVNVANLASEDAHQYRWWEAAHRPGFATEVYEQSYVACQPDSASPQAEKGSGGEVPPNPTCKVLDGGRLITGGEEMTIRTQPGQDLIWITRVHPRNPATLTVFVNGTRLATRVVPAIPGQWLEIATLIPASAITGTQTRVRTEANITDPTVGHYMPYYHWFYQGTYHADNSVTLPGPGATFGQSIRLVGRRLTYDVESRTAHIDLEWQGGGDGAGDAKVFIHLYDAVGKLVENAQIDQRPGSGTLPPGNWLPGTLRDSYSLVVPPSVAPGTYRVAIGLYEPVMLLRLAVAGEGSDVDRRLFIGKVDVR
jgi:hypothetical protein